MRQCAMPPAEPPAEPPPTARCAVHPARPALDSCPVCGRPRCGADARSVPAGGCLGCRDDAPSVVAGLRRRPRSGAVRLAMAGLAVVPAALVGGWVSSQYVGAAVFSVVLPALTGVLCGWVVLRAIGPDPAGPLVYAAQALTVLAAVGATACSFRFVPGGQSVLHPAGRVLPPYVAAAVAGWLWTRPVRRRAQAGRGTRTR